MEHRFEETHAAREFILGGNARVTIRSRKTGARFSYRVRKAQDGEIYFVSVLTGSDNESDYTYIGTLTRGHSFHHGKRAKIQDSAPSVVAFKWFWTELHFNAEALPEKVEIFHEGRCGRCARALTVPESIESGFGPECIHHIH